MARYFALLFSFLSIFFGCQKAGSEIKKASESKEKTDNNGEIKSLISDHSSPSQLGWKIHQYQNLPWEKTQLSWPGSAKISYLIFTPDGKNLVISDDAGKVVFWDVLKDQVAKTFPLPKNEVRGGSTLAGPRVYFSNSTRHFIVAHSYGVDNPVFEADTDKILFNLPWSDGGFDFSPNGKMVIGTSVGADLRIYKMSDGTLLRYVPFPGIHDTRFDCIRFGSNQEIITKKNLRNRPATEPKGNFIQVWDILQLDKVLPKNPPFNQEQYEPQPLVNIDATGFFTFELSKNREYIYSTKTLGRFGVVSSLQFTFPPLQIVQWKKDKAILKLNPKETIHCCYQLSTENQMVIGGDGFGKIHIFEFPSGREKCSFQAVSQDKDQIAYVDVSPDGSILAVATLDKVFLWDLKRITMATK